jgi:8-oxo-dGTP pyrophosphatase MutT (NUDIX family)
VHELPPPAAIPAVANEACCGGELCKPPQKNTKDSYCALSGKCEICPSKRKLVMGENPLACVKRELEEETGFRAKKIKRLISFWPTAAFANEVIHIYQATKLEKGVFHPDEDEFLGCEVWTLAQARRAVRSGKIKDSKTIIAVLAAR